MRHIILTHPRRAALPVNPATMVTWGPDSVVIDGVRVNVTTISFTDGKNRNVLESMGTVTDLFDRAVNDRPQPIDAPTIREENT